MKASNTISQPNYADYVLTLGHAYVTLDRVAPASERLLRDLDRAARGQVTTLRIRSLSAFCSRHLLQPAAARAVAA